MKKKNSNKKKNALAITGGLFTGFVNGFFGGGGGMLAVPLLNKVLKEETKVAHATAILVILPVAIVSAIAYGLSGYFSAKITLFAGIGVLIGGIIGAVLLKKLPAKVVAFVFALLMIAAGIYMTVK